MSIVEVAEFLGIPKRTLERHIQIGKFPRPIRFGGNGSHRWRRNTVEAYVAKLEAQSQRSA
jgi:excisionase family DNA binding protein